MLAGTAVATLALRVPVPPGRLYLIGAVILGYNAAALTGGATINSLFARSHLIDEMVVTIPRDGLPADVRPSIGDELQVNQDEDNPLIVRVAGLTDTTITLDGNHPLAGEDLTFRIELVEIA